GNNPAALIKAIKLANKSKYLRALRERVMHLLSGYIRQNIPMTHVSKKIFELNDATIKRVIERSLEKMGEQPPVKFAWMSLGSQGRKEQLLHTDQDKAIIFEDVCESQLDTTKSYFIKLAKIVNKSVYTIGFDYCPAGMMARNPRWCLPLRQWKEPFENWMVNPENEDILLCSI